MRMLIVQANFRDDIMMIYNELDYQVGRKGWTSETFIPFAARRYSPLGKLEIWRLIRTITWKRIGTLWNARSFFFESRRLRLWRILDFLAADHRLEFGGFKVVFIMDQKHSHGAWYAAQKRGLSIVSHQHGDYYTPRTHLAGTFRDAEGKGSIRLVWDADSLEMIRSFSPDGEFIVSGSLKHVAMQRHISAEKPVSGIVFYETIFQDPELDRSVAERTAVSLRKIAERIKEPVHVALHPLRKAKPSVFQHKAIVQIYERHNIEPFVGRKEQVNWAICSDSNALFDLVVAGVPCIFLERQDSILWLRDNYPGRIQIDSPKAAETLATLISEQNRDQFAERQLEFVQVTKIGSSKTANRAFDDILDRFS